MPDIEHQQSKSEVQDTHLPPVDDPINPQDFPIKRKYFLLGLVSLTAFLSPLTSSISAPGVQFVDDEFHVTSGLLSSFSVSIFVLGFAVGPLFLSPLSEAYGRQPVLNVSNFFLTVWQLACALSPNMASLIVFRFLGGVGGSACLPIGGGIIADLFPLAQRGRANAMFTVGPLFGPVIGPIIGGFIAQRAGWRWVYWTLLIACGVMATVNLVFGQETNYSVLRERARKQLLAPGKADTETGSRVKENAVFGVIRGMSRPVRIVVSSPILALLALYISFIFGLLYLLFTTITALFTTNYGWPVELAGLAYLGIGFGFGLGLLVVAKTSDATVTRLTKSNGDVYVPEMRLASCLYYALFIPGSFFWYGWTAEKQVHWIVPIIGLAPFGFGMMGIFASIQTYFIDVSGPFAASAVAGLVITRCIFGAFLPLAGPSMYEALGLGWGNSLLGFISLGLTPAPALIYRYGRALREKYPIVLS
ncbi:MFS general substrate transporter [Aspergillus californicus]